MAGDLLLTNLDEEELNQLVKCGGTLGDTIFHADKYGQNSWNLWLGRLTQGLNGVAVNNRTGLPPHFYIKFSQNNFVCSATPQFMKIIGAAVRPLTIVSAHQGLKNWSIKKSNWDLTEIFVAALAKADITLEIYGYEGGDLIARNTGQIHEYLKWMKTANE